MSNWMCWSVEVMSYKFGISDKEKEHVSCKQRLQSLMLNAIIQDLS